MTEVLQDKFPADGIINNYIRLRKYIGSKDRKAIAQTVWDVIRNRMKLEFDCRSKNPRDLLLTYLKDEDLETLCGTLEYGLKSLNNNEKDMLKNLSEEVYPPFIQAEMPEWLYEKIGDDYLAKSLNNTAPADFRANGVNRDDLIKKLQKEGLYFSKTPYSPLGIRSQDRVNINNCVAYQEGKMEIQDEASQIVAILCDVKPEHKIVDYCAGAGGKSLALAAILDGKGCVFAHDVNKSRLKPLPERMSRLSIKNIAIKDNIEDTDFDRFVVDAPCSGSGTFRRAPDAKFRLTPEKISDLNKIQREVLEFAYNHTKIGGEIVYITCSVLRQENHDIISDFLVRHNNCQLVDLHSRWQEKISGIFPFDNDFMLQFSPLATDTDGFFVAVLRKIS